ncbi:GtrA family protein [bacterium]|nr:GtrA family protein [bacterium]
MSDPVASPADAGGGMSLREFVRFLAAGGVAACINLAARYVIDLVLPFEAAVAIAYLIGMAVAFILFQRTIFDHPGTSLKRRIWRFSVVNAVGFCLALGLSALFARVVLPAMGWTFRPFEVAHLIGVAAPAVSSYFGHKFWTFRAG